MQIGRLEPSKNLRFLQAEGNAEIQKNAEKAVKNAMTDGLVEHIKAYAREDARKGIYMSEGFTQFRLARMKQCVSPDRSEPKAEVMSAIQAALKEPHPLMQALERILDKLSGGCSAKLQISQVQQTAEICAPNGELIASYNSLGGGWTERQTKAETKFLSETAMVYLQAYREARAEMKSAQNPAQPAMTDGTSVDLRA